MEMQSKAAKSLSLSVHDVFVVEELVFAWRDWSKPTTQVKSLLVQPHPNRVRAWLAPARIFAAFELLIEALELS